MTTLNPSMVFAEVRPNGGWSWRNGTIDFFIVASLLLHVPLLLLQATRMQPFPSRHEIDVTLVREPKPVPKMVPPVPKLELRPAERPKTHKTVRKVAARPVQKERQVASTVPRAATGAAVGNVDPSAGVQGAGGDALETVPPHKGVALSGTDIRSRMGGRTFHLEMGRIDVQGGNRLINTVIELHADGTSSVTLTHYYFQTYHGQYSSTRSESGEGHWWIDGNKWCHQSDIINYGTKDCYDITVDGPTVRLYYSECGLESSQLCKTGRIAAEGEVK